MAINHGGPARYGAQLRAAELPRTRLPRTRMKKDRKRIRRKVVRPHPREFECWTQALSSAEEFLQVSPEPLDAPHLLLGGVRI
jgi:hypothetical protein